ncbi:MAG: PAS domain-containing sensor histidine kinase [Rhodospirillales bacterium]|nr:PAS domain-containing sensor histidine kinase [Rhodospirillales bacterium]
MFGRIQKQRQDSPDTERLLSLSQEIAHVGHWHWVMDDQNIIWSDELYRIAGVSRDKFTPTVDQIKKLVHREDLGLLMQGFQQAILAQKDYEMDCRIIRPDGTIRHVSCVGRLAVNDDGDVTELYGIVQDITDRIQKEKELRLAKEDVERAYAAKSQFLANMSHELRTPLNAVIGFSDMMDKELYGALGHPKYKEYVSGIRKSGEHLLDLISDILDMSKIEAGRYELYVEDLDIEDVIHSVVQIMKGRCKDGKIKINVDMQTPNVHLRADRRALTQILLNLLSNAVKFSSADGRIQVQCFGRDDYVLLRVIDNGVGIAANKLPYVMRPFEQARVSYTRDQEGAGLGLAISKELVELHGGHIYIDSHVGQGTTVSVRLPYNAACSLEDQTSFRQNGTRGLSL